MVTTRALPVVVAASILINSHLFTGISTVVAVAAPVDEEKLVVGDTLTQDGRVGKVVDAQGVVTLKPVMSRRFTPVRPGMLLRPSDWIRTDVRGANAVALQLEKGSHVTLGPATLVELTDSGTIRLHSGVVKVVAEQATPVMLTGPGQQQVTVRGTAIYRLDAITEQIVAFEKPPIWLQGFEGATSNESIGSLVVEIDGRDVPLTVGYHKVTVDIRDQIARTVIEESFVNHTDSRLEGVFHFPLPQDASISGFGMWIGDELVEADVVEKQRAREIYETILRERRDPGLLEWTGGNIFKARVFPIFAHSEKRVKITYTQVLPRRANSYRYNYALQSELLRLHPLRELTIDVKISSAIPLRGVSSPTHSNARVDSTQYSGHVEFTAQEYVPTRDFEVEIETDGRASTVVMIPHRRGEDGYFMIQLTPPGADNSVRRDLLPDGDPLDLLVLIDTSASLSSRDRQTQAQFLASLLASLTPRDSVNVATCDVDCRWAYDRSQSVSAETTDEIRRFVEDYSSLGWTDLDRAFASAVKQCGPKTHVVYVGDGIITTGDGDPVAFGRRLKRMCADRAAGFHAVSVSSSFEPLVLKAVASLGGGSVRAIGGGQGPGDIARELLEEITRPGLSDLQIELNGLRTARVYPNELPHLPAGSQQILLGRYLPEGRDQTGELVVTGQQAGKTTRLTQRVSLDDAEQGNSFIPRLWARMHLDALLAQGTSPTIRDEIIALSEEYHIMTPYTSLLVLETDDDRERFGVKRRFLMRDAERFFATGRAAANYGLLQQQMKRAGNWRIGMRRSVLSELAGLGRSAYLLQRQAAPQDQYSAPWGFQPQGVGGIQMSGGGGGGFGGGMVGGDLAPGDRNFYSIAASQSADSGIQFGDRNAYKTADLSRSISLEEGKDIVRSDMEEFVDFDDESLQISDLRFYDGLTAASEPIRQRYAELSLSSLSKRRSNQLPAFGALERSAGEFRLGYALWPVSQRPPSTYVDWVNALFPPLPAPEKEPPAEPPEEPWPPAARALAESLLRTRQLSNLEGGLEIERRSESYDPRWDKLTGRSETFSLSSPAKWLIRTFGDRAQTIVHWCDETERGVLGRAFSLGRVRKSTKKDIASPPLLLSGFVLRSIEATYQNHSPSLEDEASDRTLMVLTHPADPHAEIRILIDTRRHVVLQVEHRQDETATSTTAFTNFVEAAGAWWASRIETTDAAGRRTSLITKSLRDVSSKQLNDRFTKELADRDRTQLIAQPLPTVKDAKQAVVRNLAAFDDYLQLVLHFSGSQQWDRVLENLEEAAHVAADQPGVRWIRNAVLNASRRRDEFRQRITGEAAHLAAADKSERQTGDSLFLANYLVSQATSVFESNEMLALLDVLRPTYESQPEHVEAMKQWKRSRVQYLNRVGQADQALVLTKRLAAEYPHDHSVQQQYANALVRVGEYPAAYEWLDRVLTQEAKWLPHEEESLRNTFVQFLRNEGRYADVAKYLATWLATGSSSQSPYAQYLSALIRSDREDEANALVARWIRKARVAGQLRPPVVARLQAAINLALGQGYNMHTNRVEKRWLTPLAETAIFFTRHATHAHLAEQIMGNGNFHSSDECRRVRTVAVELLVAEIDSLELAHVRRLIHWIWPNDPAVEPPTWERIATGLKQRWAAEDDPHQKHQWAAQVTRVLAGKIGTAEHLAFLREKIATGPDRFRANYRTELFHVLLNQPWSADFETEAFSLLDQLSDADDAAERLTGQVAALYRLTDRMVLARYNADMEKVEHQEQLTRTQLREKQTERLQAAQRAFSKRLRKQRDQHGDSLRPWLDVERLTLEVRLNRDLNNVAVECWELLGPEPPQPEAADADEEVTSTSVQQEWLDEVQRVRLLAMLTNLAARVSESQDSRDDPPPQPRNTRESTGSEARRTTGSHAAPAPVERLIDYLDKAIAANPNVDSWKLRQHQLLIALDRPEQLENALRVWIQAVKPLSMWRLALGYLLAEQGKIAEAIRLFEAVESADELGPREYRTLTDWYLVTDNRDGYDRSLVQMYQVMQEWRLNNWLSSELQHWQSDNGKLPAELDENILLVFQALFQKSGHPQNYLWQLRQFYRETRDFRLLAGLADAVVGHTPGKVYPFLGGMSSVLAEVRDEATADSIIQRLTTVRARAQTDVDHRALDLLEALVERRGAELLNQPEPHVTKALAALQRAARREWTSGEPRLMADFLAALGQISQPPLAQEQLHELRVLHERSQEGSFDRLHIAHRRADAIWSYSRYDEAIDLLWAALTDYQQAEAGVLPVAASGALDRFISYLESRGHYARGEQVLLAQTEKPVNRQQERWLTQRLYRLYQNALSGGGGVTLGSGLTLYQNVEQQLRGELRTHDHNHRHILVSRLCGIYRTAHHKRLAGPVEDLRAFALTQVPELLQWQSNDYQSIVNQVAGALRDVAGPRDGLAFLIERIENEPRWFRLNNRDGWQQHGHQLGDWRQRANDLGDLEPRLLKIVTDELRRDLESRKPRNRQIYHEDYGYFWREKRDDFARVADEVHARQKDSGASIKYIAKYLYRGLSRRDRAIEILSDAHRREFLDENGQGQLVQYLHEQQRFGESVAILEPLVGRRPEKIQYRVYLMHAYFQTKQPKRLLEFLKETDDYFHEDGRWNEEAMAKLARSCLENKLYGPATAYFEEVISFHQRTHPRRGIGGQALSDYYRDMSRAYAAWKKTGPAVDAACGAIVSWGPTHENRRQALDALKSVLRQSPDLDRYALQLDRQCDESGQENPIVRKALGLVYLHHQQYDRAIEQLTRAVEVQPNDTESHQALVTCYDKLSDKAGAIRQLLQSLQLSRRDLLLYRDLGNRYRDLQQEDAAERAYTSIVEMLPNESASHALLAGIRQQQDRWADALSHWQQVAKIRALEPTGLRKLAEAQVHLQRWEGARETLHQLRQRSWPSRFDEVEHQIRELEQKIDRGVSDPKPSPNSPF